jgi:hypothetical protein
VTEQERGDPGRELSRMLGPAGPELGCEECFDHLDAYVELELTGARADVAMPAMHAHLVGCSACRDDHDSLLAFARTDPANIARYRRDR